METIPRLGDLYSSSSCGHSDNYFELETIKEVLSRQSPEPDFVELGKALSIMDVDDYLKKRPFLMRMIGVRYDYFKNILV